LLPFHPRSKKALSTPLVPNLFFSSYCFLGIWTQQIFPPPETHLAFILMRRDPALFPFRTAPQVKRCSIVFFFFLPGTIPPSLFPFLIPWYQTPYLSILSFSLLAGHNCFSFLIFFSTACPPVPLFFPLLVWASFTCLAIFLSMFF